MESTPLKSSCRNQQIERTKLSLTESDGFRKQFQRIRLGSHFQFLSLVALILMLNFCRMYYRCDVIGVVISLLCWRLLGCAWDVVLLYLVLLLMCCCKIASLVALPSLIFCWFCCCCRVAGWIRNVLLVLLLRFCCSCYSYSYADVGCVVVVPNKKFWCGNFAGEIMKSWIQMKYRFDLFAIFLAKKEGGVFSSNLLRSEVAISRGENLQLKKFT